MLEMRVQMLRGGFLRGREEQERCGCIVRLLGGEVEVESFYISIKNNGRNYTNYRSFSNKKRGVLHFTEQ
jgi:hypothetical protein